MELLVDNFERIGEATLRPLEPMSDEEFLSFCGKLPDFRLETTADGEVIIMPPVNPETGGRNSEITGQLWLWGRGRRGKTFDSSSGFFLSNGARRSPDAAWASEERLRGLKKQSDYWHICPEFVIELRSASDRLPRLQAKMQEWIDNGVSLGWLIDPQSKSVEVYRAGTERPELLEGVNQVNGEGPVEGFVLDLRLIWQGLGD